MADKQQNETNEGEVAGAEHHGHKKASYDDINTTAVVVAVSYTHLTLPTILLV